MRDDAVIIGACEVGLSADYSGSCDEMVFEAVAGALRDAGLNKSDIGLSVVASYDLFDGSAFSNSLTTPAAAGWLTNEYRLEDDSGVALISASAAIRSGAVDAAVVVGMHQPPTRSNDAWNALRFADAASALSFGALYERPIGLTASIATAQHAARRVATSAATVEHFAEVAAAEISTGACGPRTARAASVTAEQVLAARVVATPLTELMLPAPAAGAVAIVLTSATRARMCRHPRAILRGSGVSNGGAPGGREWLVEPEAATRRAAKAAYRQAGITDPASAFDVAEFTAISPAMVEPLCDSLGLRTNGVVRNPSGGARSCYPGAANGALRVVECLDWLERHGRRGSRALSHSVDNLTGPISATSTVHVLERFS
ncbi:hypothetical protein [Antrihabitans stalactiti]|uniref:Acetyl-CoA acetyltransferase n=1 Tax=Antrihabitans stalactiti TaxID=2584121 RepID=A0A848KE53_9NOCA|nr:hypothetical protein [Antrihabitans stalactiti]NMN95898.1 hypothetical protein [Antrihabitans stalactiti]